MSPLLNNRLVFILLFFGVGIICTGIILTYQTKKIFDDSAVWVGHTYEVIPETQTVLMSLQDLQINALSFNISEDSTFAVSMRHSVTHISDAIQKLKILTLDNPYQGPRIDSMSRLSKYLIADISNNIIFQMKGGSSIAVMFYGQGKDKQYLYYIKKLLSRIQTVENNLLHIRKNANQKIILKLDRIILFLFSLQPMLIVAIFFAVRYGARIKKKTEKQQALYESIIHSSEDAIISKDLDGIITSWNIGARNIFKYTAKEILGRNISILIPPNRLQEETDIMTKLRQNKLIDTYDTERVRRDGSCVHVALTISPLSDKNGNIVGVSKIGRDITQRKMNEEALVMSLKETSDYKYALEESAIVAITDQHGFIKHVNENFCKISKYTREELIGQDHRIINSGYHAREFIRDLWTTIASGRIWKGELKNKAKDGGTYWVDTTIVPFLNEQGKPYQYIAIRADITDRKRAEEDNVKNEIRFRNTLDKMLEGVEIIGFDYRYLYVNDAYERQVKCTRKELLGFTILEKFPGIEKTEIFKAIDQCFAERIAIHLEEEYTFVDNTKTWFEISFQPVPEGVFVLSVDITEKKHAEKKIKQSEERFRSLIENSYDIVSIIDKDFKPLYRSPSAIRITGWTNEEIEETGSVQQTHPDDIGELRTILRNVSNNPGIPFPANFRTLHKNGNYVFMEGMVTNMLQTESIVGIVSNFRDVTETRKAEEKIIQSEMRFRALAENSYDIVAIVDRAFKPIYRSPSAARITGYGDDERDTIGGGTQQTHLDDLEIVSNAMKLTLENPSLPVPLRFRIKHKDGHYLLVDGIITNMLHDEAIKGIITNFRDITENQKVEEKRRESEEIYRTIAASIPGSVICLFDKDYRYLLVEGDMLESMGYSKQQLLGNKLQDVLPPVRLAEVLPNFIKVFKGESFTVESSREGVDTLVRYVPLRDKNNCVFMAMVVLFDVSELKNAQRAIAELNVSLEDRIADRTKELEIVNKELEAFSYSVAHDLRTPLRAIYGYSTMLEEDYHEIVDDEGKRLISRIVYNAKRMGMLIDDLLTFSRLGRKEVQKSLVNMKQITETCLHDLNLKETFSGKLTINELHTVMADASLLRYVMINLLSNAVKYSSKKENPVIEISSEHKGAEIIYSVKDNGVGFDMDYADKLFGVFQRLHSSEEFDGTGVGLATVQRIVHKHRGHIWADAKVNHGATFYFSLPLPAPIKK